MSKDKPDSKPTVSENVNKSVSGKSASKKQKKKKIIEKQISRLITNQYIFEQIQHNHFCKYDIKTGDYDCGISVISAGNVKYIPVKNDCLGYTCLGLRLVATCLPLRQAFFSHALNNF